MTGQRTSLSRKSKFSPRQAIGIAISIVCLVLVFRKVDFAELETSLQAFKWHFLAIGLILLASDYQIRIYRWSTMLRAGGANVSTWSCAPPFLGSIALNNVLPLRAGDVVRAFVFPSAIGVRRVTATASLLLERLIDMFTLLASLGIGLSLSPVAHVPEWLANSILILATTVCVALVAVVALNRSIASLIDWIEAWLLRSKAHKLANSVHVLGELTRNIGQMSRISVLLGLFVQSALIWAGEAGLFWAVLQGLSISSNFPAALTIMAVATLSTLAPSSPGYVGPFHLAAYSAAVMLGGSTSQAASFAVLCHLGLWLPTTLVGSIAILSKPALFRGRADAIADA
jgi:uncharacterized protein (TIRG00374 family)